MLDIKGIKTRDTDKLNETIREMLDLDSKVSPMSDISILIDCVERMSCQTHIFFDREIKRWVFTDIYDEYLVSQEFFQRENHI